MARRSTGWLALLASAIVLVALLAPAARAPAVLRAAGCAPWTMRTVASGLGVLEDVGFDGRGAMVISNNGANAIQRLSRSGAVSTLISGVPSPGGQRTRDGYLYFNTGDSAMAGAVGTTDGTIQRYDLATRRRVTWSAGLAMPNGLVFLPNGDAAVSRDVPGWGITRIPFANPMHPQRGWVATSDSNGLAVDPSGTWLYFDQTFASSTVMRARLSNPADVQTVAALGVGLVLDDLTIDRAGILYVTSNRPAPLGGVFRVDPANGQSCQIASGLGDPSAVKFGCGPGWSSAHLYAVGFGGSVYELTPPAGTRPAGACDAPSTTRRTPRPAHRGHAQAHRRAT